MCVETDVRRVLDREKHTTTPPPLTPVHEAQHKARVRAARTRRRGLGLVLGLLPQRWDVVFARAAIVRRVRLALHVAVNLAHVRLVRVHLGADACAVRQGLPRT